MIKAVLLDIDEVLIDSFESNLKFCQDLMTKTGYKPPTREEYKKLFSLHIVGVVQTLTGLTDQKEIKKIVDFGLSDAVKGYEELVKVAPCAEEAIQELHKKYTVGIVTSRLRQGRSNWPALLRRDDLFKVMITYEDTVVHKPHPAPLLLAAEKLGVKPKEAIYIGDAEGDIKAARGAGMRFITYLNDALERSDGFTKVFNELPELINQLD